MRFRTKGMGAVGRAFAGRRPRVTLAIAAASLIGLGLTCLAPAAPASAAPRHFVIYNAHSRDCMSSGGRAGAVVTQFACNGSTNQAWYFGGNHGSYQQIKNVTTNQCIGLAGGSLANGTKLQMGNCSSDDRYYWEEGTQIGTGGFLPPGVVYLANQASLRVITVACNCNTNSAPLTDVVLNDAGPPNQLWYVDYGDQGP